MSSSVDGVNDRLSIGTVVGSNGCWWWKDRRRVKKESKVSSFGCDKVTQGTSA